MAANEFPTISDWKHQLKARDSGGALNTISKPPTNIILNDEVGQIVKLEYPSINGELDNILQIGNNIHLFVDSNNTSSLRRYFIGSVYARETPDDKAIFYAADPVALLSRQQVFLTNDINYDGASLAQLVYELLAQTITDYNLSLDYPNISVSGPDPDIRISGLRKQAIAADALLKRLLKDAIDHDSINNNKEELRYFMEADPLTQTVFFRKELSLYDITDASLAGMELNDESNATKIKITDIDKQIITDQTIMDKAEKPVSFSRPEHITRFGRHEGKVIKDNTIEDDSSFQELLAYETVQSSIMGAKYRPLDIESPLLFFIRPHNPVWIYSKRKSIDSPARLLKRTIRLGGKIVCTGKFNAIPPSLTTYFQPKSIEVKETVELKYPALYPS